MSGKIIVIWNSHLPSRYYTMQIFQCGLYLALAAQIYAASFTAGPLEGLSCDSEVVQNANSAQLHSILSELADSTFFRLVRIDGAGVCPIASLRPTSAPQEATCGAAVDSFASFSPNQAFEPPGSQGSLCSIKAEESPQTIAESVVTSISKEEAHAQLEFPRDNECMVAGTLQIRPDYWLDLCSTPVAKVEYVNLKLNPERNTGYNGAAVWDEIHRMTNSLNETYEGRILEKLLSGYHASVTTQIMASYFPPSKSSGSSDWLPNAKKFFNILANPHPEWIKNMQFAFVLMARSMDKIRDLLYVYNYTTGNETADYETSQLMRHFLDSSVLSDCDQVFSAFNESSMFNSSVSPEHVAPEFKKTFRKISNLMNCVSCSRCRLHAIVAVHGIGTAIKILLTSDMDLLHNSLSRDDLVALVNTIYKFSESIELANELTAAEIVRHDVSTTNSVFHGDDLISKQLGFVASMKSKLSRKQEDALVDGLLRRDERLMLLSLHFSGWDFVRHALIALNINVPDAIVVGGGLAGLVTAISIADRGGSVVILEKQSVLGGNSAKASSGINYADHDDDREIFLQDTLTSQNGHGNATLARILVDKSLESVAWLEKITSVHLGSIGKLGGHSIARTHRPETGVVGAELIAALMRQVKERVGLIKVITRAKVVKILSKNDTVEGVEYVHTDDEIGEVVRLDVRSVVLASGGFGFDSEGLVRSYRPDLVEFPTTLGSQTTGDGIRLAASVGAELIDMEYVQLHPTGFVDPKNLNEKTKILAAEILRGIGGVLLVQNGGRFVNELSIRKVVTDEMLKQPSRIFWIVLSDRSAEMEERLLGIYESRGLLRRVTAVYELEQLIGEEGMDSLREYSDESVEDKFGRKDRKGLPLDRDCQYWLIGQVTPVVHYTMGGIKVDDLGRVIGARSRKPVPGLFAVGEVAGGVHGENRLGGNSLLECTVFGRIIGGESIEIIHQLTESQFPRCDCQDKFGEGGKSTKSRQISLAEVRDHDSAEDCWTVIEGKVYDLSNYASDHPGGVASIQESCGKDSSKRFLAAHSLSLLEDIGFQPIGISS